MSLTQRVLENFCLHNRRATVAHNSLCAVLILLCYFLIPSQALAAAFNDAASGNWNDGATWGNVSPGVQGVDYPGVNDTATIDSHVVTVTTNQSTGGVTVSGGTLNLGANQISLNGNWTYSSGTVDAGTSTLIFTRDTGGSQTVNAPGMSFHNVTLNKGTYGMLNATGAMQIDGVYTINAVQTISGTVRAAGDVVVDDDIIDNASTWTLEINGSGDQQLSAAGGVGELAHVNINKAGGTLTIVDTFEVNESWTHTAGAVDAAASNIQFIRGTGNQTVNASGMAFGNVTLIKGAYGYLTVTGTMDIDGIFTVTSAQGINGGTVQASGDVIIDDEVLSYDSTWTLELNGTGAQTLGAAGGVGYLNAVVINKASGTLTIEDTFDVEETWTHTAGTVDPGTSTLRFIKGSGTQPINAPGMSFNNVTISKGDYALLSIPATVDINGTFTITSASSISGGTIQVAGHIVADDDYLDPASDWTLEINGTVDQTLSAGGGIGDLSHVVINKASGTLTIVDTLETDNDWTHTAGTVDASASTIRFVGGGAAVQQINASGMAFGNVTINKPSYRSAAVTGTMDVDGNFVLSQTDQINTGTIVVSGNLTNTDTDTNGTATFRLDGSATQTITFTGAESGFDYPLEINKSGGQVNLASAVTFNTAAQNFTVVEGILNLNGYNLTVSPGTLTIQDGATFKLRGSETFSTPSLQTGSTVIYDATSSLTLPASITTYYNLTLDESGTSNPTFTLPDSNVTITGALNVADGTLAYDNDKNLTVSDNAATGTAITVGAGGRLTNTGTGDLTVAGNISNAGTITFNSSDAANGIVIASNNTTPRDWAGAGTFRMVDVAVSYQTANSGTPTEILAYSSTDSGNNNNWNFNPPLATISGTVFTDEGITNIGAGKTVAISINGGAAAGTDDTDASGDYSIAGLAISPGDVITAYIEDETENGVVVTVLNGSDLSNVDIYQNYLILRQDDGGALTNANLTTADTNGDADISAIYNASGTTLNTVNSTQTLIPSGHTFEPGGVVNIGSSGTATHLDVDGTWTAAPGETLSVRGDFDSSGTYSGSSSTPTIYNSLLITAGTFTFSSGTSYLTGSVNISGGTVNLDGTIQATSNWTHATATVNPGSSTVLFNNSVTQTVNASGMAFNNVTLNNTSNGDFNVTGTLDVDGTFTLTSVDLIAGGTIQVAGDVVIADSSVHANGNWILELNGTGAQSLGAAGGTAGLSSVVVNKASGTLTLADTLAVNDSWTYTSGTVNAGTSTVVFNNAVSQTVNSAAMAFNNVTLTNTANGDFNVTGTMDVDGIFTITTVDVIYGGTIQVAGDVVIPDSSVHTVGDWTLELNGTGAQTLGAGGLIAGLSSVLVNKASGTLTLADTLWVDDNWTYTTGTVDAGTSTVVFINGNGQTVNSGAMAFNNVSLAKGNNGDLNVTGTMDVDGTFTISTVDSISGGTIQVAGDVLVTDSTVHVNVNWTLELNGTGAQMLSAGGGTASLSSVVINKASGTLTLADTLSVDDSWTHTAGTVDAGTSRVVFTNIASQTVNASGMAFNDVTLSKGANGNLTVTGTMDIDGTLTISSVDFISTGTVALSGNFTNVDSDTNGTAVFLLDGSATQTIDFTGATSGFDYDLLVNKSGGQVNLLTAVTFNTAGQDLTIQEGTFDLNGNTLSVSPGVFTVESGGNFQLQGAETFTTPTLNAGSAVTYDGTGSITLPASITTYYNLNINESGTSNPTFTLPDSHVTVNGVLNVTDGILAFDNDKNLTANDNGATGTAITVGAAGRLSNTGTGDLTIAGNVSNAGTIAFNSSDAADGIVIASNNTTPRDWAGAGSFSMVDVAVSYQTANSGTPTEVRAYSSTDSGNNNNWSFNPTSTISGTVFTDEGVTNIGAGKTVAISINGAAAAGTDDTDASGNYEIVGLTIAPDDRVVVYIDGETEKGTTVTVAAGTDLAGFDIYQNHVIVRNDYAGGVGYTTNADLAGVDNADADIRYVVSGGNLTVDAGYELYIWTGDEFRPGGNVANASANSGGIEINGTWTATGSETITVYYSWDAADGIFAAATSNVTFNIPGNNGSDFTVVTGGVGSDHDFYNVSIATGGRQFVLNANDMKVGGSLSLNTGYLNLTNDLYVDGDVTLVGLGMGYVVGAGDVVMSGTGLQTINNPAGEATAQFNLRITNSSVPGVVLANPITVSAFTMSAGAVFDCNGIDMTVGYNTDSVWTIDPTASFTTGNNTITFSGYDKTITTGGTDSEHDFNNVVVNVSNRRLIVSTDDMKINGTLEVQSGRLEFLTDVYLFGDLTISSTNLLGAFHTAVGEVVMAGSGLQTVNNSVGETESIAAMRITNTSPAGVVLADAISVNAFVMDGNSLFDANGKDLQVGVSNGATAWTIDPTANFITGNNTVTFVGYSKVVSTGGTDSEHDFNNVVVNITNSQALILNSADMQINGALTLTAGRLTLTNNLYLDGDLTITSTGVIVENGSGSVIFNGSSLQTISNAAGETDAFADVQISNASGVRLNNNVVMAITTINSGAELDLNGRNLTTTGVFTHNGTLRLEGGEVLTFSGAGGFDEDSGTVIFDGTGTYAAGLPNSFGDQFYNLTFDGSGGVWTLDANTTVANNFTATAGTLDINDFTFAISGNTVINGGTVATGTNTVTFGNAGGDSVTISGGELRIESDVPNTDIVKNAGTWTNSGGTISYAAGSVITQNLLTAQTAYYNLAVNSNGSTYTIPDANIIVDGRLTVTDGTLAFDNDKSVTVNDAAATGTALSVAAAGTLSNTGTADLVLGGGVANAGSISFNSSDDAGNGIAISSSDGVTARQWAGAGTFSMTDVTVSDQTASLADPEYVLTVSSADGGDNSNWVFPTGTLTGLSVTPASLSKGATTTATVAFTTENVVASDGKIKITFPAGFDVSGVTTATSAADIDGTLGVSVAGQVVTITRSTGTALAEGSVIDDLVLTSIVNPNTAGATGTFAVSTTDAADTVFDSGTAAAVTVLATVEIAGTVYTGEGVTNIGAGKTVAISINGAAAVTVDTNASGQYLHSGVTLSDGDRVVLYLDNETENATTVTVASNTSFNGVNLYQDHVIVRHDYTTGYTTNANLSSADNGDNEILYNVSGGNLAVDANAKLFIWDGDEFRPGGNVANLLGGGGIKIKGTWEATGNETITAYFSWDASDGVFHAANSTVTFTTYSSNFTVLTGGADDDHDFYNLEINHENVRILFMSTYDAQVSNQLTINGGQLALTTDIYVYGDVDIQLAEEVAGTPMGEIVMSGSSLQTISAVPDPMTYYVAGLRIANTSVDGVVLSNAVSFASFVMEANTTFDAAGYDFHVGIPNTDTFWTVDPSAKFISGNNTVYLHRSRNKVISTGGTDADHDFYNVVFGGNYWYNVVLNSADMRINGSVQMTEGALNLTNNILLYGDLHITNLLRAEGGSGDIIFTGSSLQTIYNPSGETDAVVEVQIANGAEVVLANPVTLSVTTIDSGGVFDLNGSNLTATGVFTNNGTLRLEGGEVPVFSGAGGFDEDSGTVEFNGTGSYAGGLPNVFGDLFYNLTFDGAGGVWTLDANTTATNNFTASDGTLDVNDRTFTINGNTLIDGGVLATGTNTVTFGNAAGDSVLISSGELRVESDVPNTDIVTNAGTWTNSGGTISYMAGAAVTQNLLTGQTAYYNLTVNSNGSTYTLPDSNITVDGRLTVTDGTLVFDNDKNLDLNDDAATGTALSVGAAGMLSNTGTGNLTLGGGVSNAGSISFNSSDDAGNAIVIATDDGATARTWTGDGTFSFVDVAVSYQTVANPDPEYIIATSSTDSGNNTNWVFPLGDLTSADVTPASLATSASGNVTVELTNEQMIPTDGKIVVVFPAGFDVSGVSGATSAADIDGSLAVGISGQTVTITRSGGTLITAGSVINDLVIAGVVNPAFGGLTGNFTISTTDSNDVTFDTVSVAGVTITGGTDYVWTGSGDGTSWEDEDNWDVGVGYPDDNLDTATINSTADVITTSGARTVGAYTQGGTFSGSVTLGGAFTVDDAGGRSGDFTVSEGTFDTNIAASHALNIDGDWSTSGGMTLARSSTFTTNGDISISSAGTYFDSGSSTVVLVNDATISNASFANHFHNLTQNNGVTTTLVGTIQLSDGLFTTGDATSSFRDDNNAAVRVIFLSSAAIVHNGAVFQSLDSLLIYHRGPTFAGGDFGNVEIRFLDNGTTTLTGNLNAGGVLIRASNPNQTQILDTDGFGVAVNYLEVGNAVSGDRNGVLNASNSIIEVVDVITVSDANAGRSNVFNAQSSTISLAGNWESESALAVAGVFNPGTSTVVFEATSGSPTIVSSGSSFNDVVINDAGNNITFTLEDAFDANGDLTITGGTLDTKTGENNSIAIGGNFTNNDIFISRSGTVTFDGTTAQSIDAGGSGIANDDANTDFNNVTISNTAAAVTLLDELEVDGTLTIDSSAVLDVDGFAFDLNGTLANNGTLAFRGAESRQIAVMDTNSGTVRYHGTAAVTLPSDITTYFNLTLDESATSDPTYTLPNSNFVVNGVLDVADAVLAFDDDKNLTVNDNGATGTAMTIAAGSAIQNTGTGNLTLGGDVVVDGEITFDSSDDAGNSILITSTGAAREWSGAGTFSMTDVTVADQSANIADPQYIIAVSSTDDGGTTNWIFSGGSLTDASVTVPVLDDSATNNVTVGFTTQNLIPVDGKIVIDFPAGFDLSGVTTATSANDIDGALAVTVIGQSVVITRSGGTVIAPAAIIDDLVIANVVNPSAAGLTAAFTLRTRASDDTNIDAATVAGVVIAATQFNVSVSITFESSALSGVSLTSAQLGNATTDGSGEHDYGAVATGTSYVITPSKTGYVFSPTSVTVASLNADAAHSFTATALFEISGVVRVGTTPLGGVTIDGGVLGTATSNSSGVYSFSSVVDATAYTLTPSKTGYTFSPGSVSSTLSGANAAHNFSAILDEGEGITIGGKVLAANAEGSPIPGVTISNGQQSAVTDAQGNFALHNVEEGDYTLTAVKDNFKFEQVTGAESLSVSDQDIDNLVFEARRAPGRTVYAMWNGFLNSSNIAEIINYSSTRPLVVQLQILSNIELSSNLGAQASYITIPPGRQQDVVVNMLDGYSPDSYGIVKVTASHSDFDGRLSVYRPKPMTAEQEFGYAVAFTSPSTGVKAFPFNTFYPGLASSAVKEVHQWLTLANTNSARAAVFTIEKRNFGGEILSEEIVNVAPLERRDFEAGHTFPGLDQVGLIRVIPHDSSLKYYAQLNRYAFDSATKTFDFAVALPPATDSETKVRTVVSNPGNTYTFVEIANQLGTQQTVDLKLRNDEGELVFAEQQVLAPYAQFHLRVDQLLDVEESGIIEVGGRSPGAIVAFALSYVKEKDSDNIFAAYESPLRDSYGTVMYGSFNMFLNMLNAIRIGNVSDNQTTVRLHFGSGGDLGASSVVKIEPHATKIIEIGREFEFSTLEDNKNSYGMVSVETTSNGAVIPELIRLGVEQDHYQFGVSTQIR